MKRTLLRLTFCLTALLAMPAVLSGFPEKPAVEGPVNDLAGILDHDQVVRLQHLLVDFADSTSNQLCVVTVNDLEGYDISEYAIKLALQWKVGSEEFNNGILFLIKPKLSSSDWGGAYIAVGRGLEGAIPDVYCYRIVNETAIPYFAEGDYFNGIWHSCIKIMEYADSEYHKTGKEKLNDALEVAMVVIFAVLVFFVLILVIKASGKNGGGGRGNGGSGSSDDFGRGIIFGNTIGMPHSRGGFSGGGFSGGFSGGFGGGSFGGGGGGGRW